jgi:hypothetical protein
MKDRELLAAMAMQALIKVQRLRRLLLSQWLAEAHRPGPSASHEPLLRPHNDWICSPAADPDRSPDPK